MQGACLWGTICNASAGMGSVVTEGYGLSPWAIFVRPDSRIHKPEDLKDVPISVGMRAGSHFNVPYRLEKYLPLETSRWSTLADSARAFVPCSMAKLRPPACCLRRSRWRSSSACARLWKIRSRRCGGFRQIRHPNWSMATCGAQTRRAGAGSDLQKYLPLWKLAIPPDFENVHAWDFSRFGRGERYIDEPLPEEDFGSVFQQVQRWKLDDFLKEKRPEQLSYPAA